MHLTTTRDHHCGASGRYFTVEATAVIFETQTKETQRSDGYRTPTPSRAGDEYDHQKRTFTQDNDCHRIDTG
jgi:hypothetical protein